MFMIEKGKKYRFRMINACSTVCLVEVKIENHPMQIIATDGENVKPLDADGIIMATGNIYLTYVYIMCIYRVFPVSRNKIKP